MAKLSKNYQKAFDQIDKAKKYEISQGIELIKKIATTKFDSSVEIALKLGIDAKQSNQQLRGAHILPHGSGKSKKVIAICKEADQKIAQAAGADFVGAEEIIEKIKIKKWLDFDVVVSTPDLMPKLAMLGQILGPKGLMPNPKTGTLTTDVGKAVKEIKNGKIEFRNDKEGNIHAVIGKVSFETNKLVENYHSFIKLIRSLKPATAKGIYFQNISLSS